MGRRFRRIESSCQLSAVSMLCPLCLIGSATLSYISCRCHTNNSLCQHLSRAVPIRTSSSKSRSPMCNLPPRIRRSTDLSNLSAILPHQQSPLMAAGEKSQGGGHRWSAKVGPFAPLCFSTTLAQTNRPSFVFRLQLCGGPYIPITGLGDLAISIEMSSGRNRIAVPGRSPSACNGPDFDAEVEQNEFIFGFDRARDMWNFPPPRNRC
jgi:hypothetical protein